MSLKNIAVESWTYSFGSGSGNVTVTNQPSNKVKFDGKKAFFDKIEFSISNYIGGGINQGSASGSISGSATKLTIEGKAAVLEGDESLPITIYGTSTVYPYNPDTATDTVKVLKAGQSKAKAE